MTKPPSKPSSSSAENNNTPDSSAPIITNKTTAGTTTKSQVDEHHPPQFPSRKDSAYSKTSTSSSHSSPRPLPIPQLRKLSSKLSLATTTHAPNHQRQHSAGTSFSHHRHPSSPPTSPSHPHLLWSLTSNKSSLNLAEQVLPSEEFSSQFDYDPISASDARSFEDDGQEGSLQDALLSTSSPPENPTPTHITTKLSCLEHDDGLTRSSPSHSQPNSPNSLNPSSPPLSNYHHNQQQQQQQHIHSTPKTKAKLIKNLKPGKQHGATAYPVTPPSASTLPLPSLPSSHPSTSKSPSKSSFSPRLTPRMAHPLNTHNRKQSASTPPDCFAGSPPADSLLRPKPLSPSHRSPRTETAFSIVTSGPSALPSRLSGWFQQAFSSSSSVPAHLPTLVSHIPSMLAPPPPVQSSPDKNKGKNTGRIPSPLDQSSFQQNDSSTKVTLVQPRGSPAPTAHTTSTNIRGLGNLFDKVANYMFDTDAHSYDSRLTSDLVIMGGQHFSGVWKWDEPYHHDHGGPDDYALSLAHGGGTGSGSDASHAATHLKKKSGFRRVTVAKSKGIFKHHPSSPSDPLRRSADLASSSTTNLTQKTRGVSFSPSPTPSPEPTGTIPIQPSIEPDACLLSAAVTHSYPPDFFHAFASVIGLTYRSDFPPIPCASDRLKVSGLGVAGAKVGGMLASLSLSIGRNGKKARNAHGGSRSPSPHRLPGEDDEDRQQAGGYVKGLTTDVGWGCMLRTGQSLLANALLVAHLGREWRRPTASITDPSGATTPDAVYARLLSWFIDSTSPLAPFSIHRFALKGKELGKEVGEWFGPSTAAGAIKALTLDFPAAGLGVVTDMDGTVYRSDVYAASSCLTSMGSGSRQSSHSLRNSWDRPVLVLANLRLGLDGVNPSYHEAIKATFLFPQSVGIAGGRPSSSYYFCGFQGDSLFYIDPHHSRPAIPLEEPPDSLVVPAQRVTVGYRVTAHSSRLEGDWEQVSSTDSDSILSGSVSSEAVPRPYPTVTSPRKMTSAARASSRSSYSVREPLDEFYTRAYPDSALRTFHPDKVRRMTLTAMDPSMLVGFLVRDSADWEDLTARIRSFKPALFHIADATPSWMRQNSEASESRESQDLRPSDDSDLGVDSWSEPDEWGTAGRAEEFSSGESRRRSGDTDGIQETETMEDDAEQTGKEKDEPVEPMNLEDDGWDNVQGNPSSKVVNTDSTPTSERNQTVRGKGLASSFDFKKSNSPPVHSGRPQALSPHPQKSHSFGQGLDHIRRLEYLKEHSTSADSEADEQLQSPTGSPDNSLLKLVNRRSAPMGVVLSSVFPTHPHISAPTSPTPGAMRDEPRSRNVSAATVRARQSDEHLADNEESLNHQQRRRLDSQGSLRALVV